MPQRFIVGEISKNWPELPTVEHFWQTHPKSKLGPDGFRRLLCQRFEDVIERNWSRGYRLIDWKYNRVVGPTGVYKETYNETIIAVFELREPPPEVGE